MDILYPTQIFTFAELFIEPKYFFRLSPLNGVSTNFYLLVFI